MLLRSLAPFRIRPLRALAKRPAVVWPDAIPSPAHNGQGRVRAKGMTVTHVRMPLAVHDRHVWRSSHRPG